MNIWLVILLSILSDSNQKQEISFISFPEQQFIIKTATEFLDSLPVAVTVAVYQQASKHKECPCSLAKNGWLRFNSRVIRSLPIRNPLLWLEEKPVK